MEIRKIRVLEGGKERKPTIDEIKTIADKIEYALTELGFRSPYGRITADYGRYFVKVSNVRLNKEIWGLNVSPYQEAMGYTGMVKNYPILNYWQWGIVNVSLNTILDLFGVSANVRSLRGLFVIREGTEKYGFDEWRWREDDNIGSIMYPVIRCEAWRPKSKDTFSLAVDRAEIKLLKIVEDSDLIDLTEIHDYITENFRYIREYCPFYVYQKKVIEYE